MSETSKIVLVGVSGLLSGLAIGTLIGYKIVEKKLAEEFEARLDQELTETRQFYGAVFKEKEYPTPADAVNKLVPKAADALKSYAGQISDTDRQKVAYDKIVNTGVHPEVARAMTGEDPEEAHALVAEYGEEVFEEIKRNVFEDENSEAIRIISLDEFTESELISATLTYYTDDVLTDDTEEKITDVINTVGDKALHSFGHLSEDTNIVYVRNLKLGLDFEIVKSMKTYSEDVLGIEQEPPLVKPSDRVRRGG